MLMVSADASVLGGKLWFSFACQVWRWCRWLVVVILVVLVVMVMVLFDLPVMWVGLWLCDGNRPSVWVPMARMFCWM